MKPGSSTSSSEAAPPTSADAARPWLWALLAIALIELGVMALVPVRAAVDLGVPFFALGAEPSFTEAVIEGQGTRVARAAPGAADVVVVGDSSGLTGVIPELVAAGLRGVNADGPQTRVENLCTVAPVSLAGQLDLLERWMGGHGAPRVVVLYVSAGSVAISDAEQARVGLAQAFRAWLGTDTGVAGFWPSHRLRPWGRHLLAALAGGAVGGNQLALQGFLDTHRGYLREPDTAKPDPSAPRLVVPLHADALAAVARLLELAERHDFQVLWVNAMQSVGQADPAARAEHAENFARLRGVAGQVPRLQLAEPWLRLQPDAAFGAANHPRLPAARENSLWLGDALRPVWSKTRPIGAAEAVQ